jgi:hypothetical protein
MTPSPPVVVEMSASDASTPYARVLVAACSDGLRGGGPCGLESTAVSDPGRAVAIVSWDGTGRGTATIEVGVRRGARAEWLTRRVTFDPSDAEVERWRSVGLIIATLVGSESARDAAPPSAHAVPPAPAPPSKPVPRDPAPPAPSLPGPSWFFELGADLARGGGDIVGAGGPNGRIGAAFRSTAVFVTGSVRYEVEPHATSQVRLEWGWASVGVGLAAPLADGALLVEGRFEPTAGVIRASVSGGSPQQSGALFGAREGGALTWWWGRSFGLSLSLELLETTRSTVVTVSNASGAGAIPVATAQWLGWSGGLGLRFRTE